MKSIILAAGRGSRLGQLTDNLPKCLIKLDEETLLERQIKTFKKFGIEDIGIVTGYRRDLILKFNLFEFFNPDWASTNMVSSLEKADYWLQRYNCIVSYGDIFYDIKALKILNENNDDMALTYDPNWYSIWEKRFKNPLDDAENFKLNEDSNILKIGGRSENVSDIEGQYMGLVKFTPVSWSEVIRIRSKLGKTEKDKMDMTSLIQKIIEENQIKVKGIAYKGQWGEVDSESDLKVFQSTLK